MKSIGLSFLVMALLGCKSDPKAVNSERTIPLWPAISGNDSSNYEGLGRPPIEALTGKVVLKSDIPIPLAHLTLGLFQIQNSRKKLIVEFTTDSDGSFRITRPLQMGFYELVVIDKKYEGTFPVSLENSAARNRIFEATKKAY
jgi:hypothetical protein